MTAQDDYTYTLLQSAITRRSKQQQQQQQQQPQEHPDDIRRWGCARTETPLIFVHIGKAGGGSVRARFATSALNYTRGQKWKSNKDDGAYYAIRHDGDEQQEQKGYFCNSAMKNFRFNSEWKTFEGTRPCGATTPIGLAIACPHPIDHFDKCLGCSVHDEQCHRLYTGHNYLGNELHWLPPRYLQNWWKTQQPSSSLTTNNDFLKGASKTWHELAQAFESIQHGNTEWCPSLQQARFQTDNELEAHHDECSVPLAAQMDQLARKWAAESLSNGIEATTGRRVSLVSTNEKEDESSLHWGPLYASLPVLRTTIVRDPFSWLVSKFFWHSQQTSHDCANVTAATQHVHNPDKVSRPNHDKTAGWAHRMARIFIIQLCGEDCQIRWEMATRRASLTMHQERLLLESFEMQADYNLRHSFAVVGRIEDIDGFYEMVARRVQYLPRMTDSHESLQDDVSQRHASGATPECKQLYDNEAFRREMIEASPAVAILVRLYRTALRVNAFQKQELETCVR